MRYQFYLWKDSQIRSATWVVCNQAPIKTFIYIVTQSWGEDNGSSSFGTFSDLCLMQFKTTMEYHLTSVRITKKIMNIGKDVLKFEHLYTVSGNEKLCNHYGTQYGGSSKN